MLLLRDTWGAIESSNSSAGIGSASDDTIAGLFRYLYTGQEWDPETGYYNYHARLYDPTIGRFIDPDPKHQFPSPYLYCGNNPINYNDPTGKMGGANKAFLQDPLQFLRNHYITLALGFQGQANDTLFEGDLVADLAHPGRYILNTFNRERGVFSHPIPAQWLQYTEHLTHTVTPEEGRFVFTPALTGCLYQYNGNINHPLISHVAGDIGNNGANIDNNAAALIGEANHAQGEPQNPLRIIPYPAAAPYPENGNRNFYYNEPDGYEIMVISRRHAGDVNIYAQSRNTAGGNSRIHQVGWEQPAPDEQLLQNAALPLEPEQAVLLLE